MRWISAEVADGWRVIRAGSGTESMVKVSRTIRGDRQHAFASGRSVGGVLCGDVRSGSGNRGRQRSRGGIVILEVLLVLPVMIAEFLAVFQFGILALVVSTATAAVVDGARTGALVFPASLPYDNVVLDPTGDNDIADAIALQMNRFLAGVGMEIQDPNSANVNPAKHQAYVRIIRNQVVSQRGDASLAGVCTVTGPAAQSGEVVVVLCFRLVNPPDGRPVPDLLATFGVSLADRYFNVTSRAPLQ